RSTPQPRSADKVFHTRVEGQFRSITRHGASPSTYWWEVVNKNGTRSFYGSASATSPSTSDFTLADDNGNIFTWVLREVRDLHGNGMTYTYARVADPGVSGGTVPGTQLYLKTINYTRSGDVPGAYTVTFVRDTELPSKQWGSTYKRRPDVVI